MATRRQPLTLDDFRGGVNLLADAFQLAENEMPEMLNMDIGRRGGATSRRGWLRWGATPVTAETWNPRSMFQFNPPGVAPITMIANNGKILHSQNGAFSVLSKAAVSVPANCDWHGADYAAWAEKLYIACGATAATPAHRWSGTGDAVALAAASSTTFNGDYTAPTQGVVPTSELIVTHYNYLFVADTHEDGIRRSTRFRWSHANNPEDWAAGDYIDILGAGKITALVSFRDHLLIFGQEGIWALYGIDADSWQLISLTSTVSAASPSWVAKSEQNVYFFSMPAGIHRYDGTDVLEVSDSLRPIFTDGSFGVGTLDKLFLGFMNRRLWFGAPWVDGAVATDTASVFVLDPTLTEGGSWVRYVGADGQGVGPFSEDAVSNNPKMLACSRTVPAVLLLDQEGVASDNINGTVVPFKSFFTTRWANGGISDHNKSWKRPTFIVKESPSDYTIGYEAFKDYDEADAERSGTLSVRAATTPSKYGDLSKYGDGSRYGAPAKGAILVRGGSLGSGVAVSLRLTGTPGIPWGVDSITHKTIARRYK